jgi:hypothetical protein
VEDDESVKNVEAAEPRAYLGTVVDSLWMHNNRDGKEKALRLLRYTRLGLDKA